MDAKDQALWRLGKELRDCGYHFTTITPTSHHRVVNRSVMSASPLQCAFGWSLPFSPEDLPNSMVAFLETAGELESVGNQFRSKVRFSTLGSQLFVHSAFPTEAADTVFFGPDTYRFAGALRHALSPSAAASPFNIIDIGCGSGAGGLYAAALMEPIVPNVILADINPKALRFSEINAKLNGVSNLSPVLSDLFENIEVRGDLIISNPPYLVDSAERLYRHGGGEFGFELSLRIVREGLDRLNPGGTLFLYTGTPVVDGVDQFFEAVHPVLAERGCPFAYEEIDPDVFGEELNNPPYDRADRIAVVGLTVHA